MEVGDTVNSGDKLVDLYNDRTMVLKVPFLNTDANQISAGDAAQVQILETYETVSGTVTAVSSMEQTLSGGSVVRMVTIEVGNPGGISTSSTAAATVNGLACSGDGTFTAKLEETVTADHGGEIASMAVEEGSYVHEGATLFTYTQESADDALQTVQDSLETAEQSVEDAESELENTQDSLEDYEITAPISGQVIVKNTKAGDTLNSGGDSNTAMAIIYDMSALTFDMYVDELDVLDVEVGQKVEVTVDAFEGETFTGQVTNVSLESTSSNGVTQYPVTVQMDEVGDLLPGMNVNGEIIIDEAENALAIPAQALQRGNHFLATNQFCRTGISMEFTMTREPHGDNARQNTKHQFQNRCNRKVDQRVAVALFTFITISAHKTRGKLRQNTGNKDNEGVHHALNQRHGDHITIGDVADFVSNYRLGFIRAHVLQQTGADSNQRGITARTGCKSVDVRRMVDSHLRHSDPRLTSLGCYSIDQPTFPFVTRLLDHFPANRS